MKLSVKQGKENRDTFQRVLMAATVPSMIGQFNMHNLHILLDLGYEIDIATDFNDRSFWPEERVQRFKKQMQQLGISCFQVDFSRNPSKIMRHIASYREAVDLIGKRRYAFIHTHTPIASAIMRIAAHKLRTRVIYTAHGFHFYDGAPFKNWIVFYPVEKMLSWWTNTLITINKEDYLRANKSFHAKHVAYIPGVGVETERFEICKVKREEKRTQLGLKEEEFLLLSFLDSCGMEYITIVLGALSRMKKYCNQRGITYLIAGEEESEGAVASLIAEYGLADYVRMLGPRDDMGELCEAADCFVCESIGSNLSAFKIEAMASALPFIYIETTNMTDIKDWRHVDSRMISKTSTAISRMCEDADYRRDTGENNWRIVRHSAIKDTIAFDNNALHGCVHFESLLIRQTKRYEFGIEQDDFVVISVGELNRNKNHQIVIKAIAQIDDPSVKYVIVGKDSLDNELTLLSESLGIADRVILTGFRLDVRELLWMSDCFAFPSMREGLGLAAIEAMAAGLPVVACESGGIKDYINEPGNEVVHSRTAEGFASSILRVKSKQSYERSKLCNTASKSFDCKKVDEAMENLYKHSI